MPNAQARTSCQEVHLLRRSANPTPINTLVAQRLAQMPYKRQTLVRLHSRVPISDMV